MALFSIDFLYLSVFSYTHSSKQLNTIKERTGFVHFRGLFMPMCRSPPFFVALRL